MQRIHVTPLEIAVLRFDLTGAYGPIADRPGGGSSELPVLAYHLALPGRSVLVDAPGYDAETTPDVYRLPGYEPPPPLLEQLRRVGIDPVEITDVVITHAHFDHLGALERAGAAGPVPAFPAARHYLGRGDWDPEAFAVMGREDLLTVDRAGLLELVDGDVELGDGVSLVAAPGESPGHVLARAQLGDDVVYVAGDLYHHAIEFDHADLNVVWVDTPAMRSSKRSLLQRAERESARAYFSHIRGAHVVRQVRGAPRWSAVGGP